MGESLSDLAHMRVWESCADQGSRPRHRSEERDEQHVHGEFTIGHPHAWMAVDPRQREVSVPANLTTTSLTRATLRSWSNNIWGLQEDWLYTTVELRWATRELRWDVSLLPVYQGLIREERASGLGCRSRPCHSWLISISRSSRQAGKSRPGRTPRLSATKATSDPLRTGDSPARASGASLQMTPTPSTLRRSRSMI